MLCLRFEILSESFNLRKKFRLRYRNVNYPLNSLFFKPQCYELKKLTIFIVENMVTHPPFMFYYKHFLADNLNYVSQKIYFRKIGFLENMGACKCLDYQGSELHSGTRKALSKFSPFYNSR